jgi:hypothetical protein
MAWVAAIGAAASAAYGAYSSNAAADAQGKGSKRALAAQNAQYGTNLQMLEPQRYVGYQALDQLAKLYGFGSSGYQPANMLLQSGGGGGAGVKGSYGGNAFSNMPNPSPLAGLGHNPLDRLGSDTQQYGGSINPITGMVDVKGAGANKDALLTNYLRTGEWTGGQGGKTKKLRSSIDALREQGYTYGPNGGAMPGTVAPRAAGEPGDMSGFFAAPDYEFRRTEGERGIGNSFAARGGAASGNALRALTEFNSGLASGEYGNYVNRLMSMAGMGQTATGSAISAGQNNANAQSVLQQNIGDARASGVMGTANTLTDAWGNWQNYDIMKKYLASQGGQSAPANAFSNYGPWASGYRGL